MRPSCGAPFLQPRLLARPDALACVADKCFEADGKCWVDPAKRTDCGFHISKESCEAKGCCYDDTLPGTFYCFNSAEGPPPSPPSPPAPPGPTPPGPPPPPGPPGAHYGDPLAGPCTGGDQNVTITGVPGAVCAPSCSTSSPCPPAPAGVTSAGQCILEAHGTTTPNLCVMVCKSNDEERGMTVLDGGACPEHATCKPIQTTAVCTYDE